MEQTRFRCHISIILNKVGAIFVFVLILLYNNASEVIGVLKSGRLPGKDMLFGFAALLAVTAGYAFWQLMRWYKTWIMFEDGSIVIERNTLNRKVNTIGMKNISNVNLEQNLLQRLLRVYQVKLDINSASTADSADMNIVLKEDKARAFQKTVLAHLGQETGAKQENAELVPQIVYNGWQVVKHCLATFKLVWFLVGILTTLAAAFTLWEQIDEAADLLDMMLANLAVLVFLATTIWNLVGDFFRLYGFRAGRSGNQLFFSHGLLKKQEYVIPVEKINAVIVRQNLTARILKRSYVELVCIGLGDEKKEGTQIMLASRQEELERNMQLLLPEYEKKLEASLERQPVTVFRSRLLLYLFAVLAAGAAAAVCFYIAGAAWLPGIVTGFLAVLVLFVFGEILQYRTEGIYCDEEKLVVASGIFSRQVVYIAYEKIQILKTTQGPFLKRCGLYRGEMHILASLANSIHLTGCYQEDVFEKIHENMLKKRQFGGSYEAWGSQNEKGAGSVV